MRLGEGQPISIDISTDIDDIIDFIAGEPGATLLHWHHQDHKDEGFIGLVAHLLPILC